MWVLLYVCTERCRGGWGGWLHAAACVVASCGGSARAALPGVHGRQHQPLHCPHCMRPCCCPPSTNPAAAPPGLARCLQLHRRVHGGSGAAARQRLCLGLLVSPPGLRRLPLLNKRATGSVASWASSLRLALQARVLADGQPGARRAHGKHGRILAIHLQHVSGAARRRRQPPAWLSPRSSSSWNPPTFSHPACPAVLFPCVYSQAH